MTKLTDEQVFQIRMMPKGANMSQIAQQFRVSRSHVSRIRSGKTRGNRQGQTIATQAARIAELEAALHAVAADNMTIEALLKLRAALSNDPNTDERSAG